MKSAIHKNICHNLCTYPSARHSYHSVKSLNISAQCEFCLINCFRHRRVWQEQYYIHRCHEETLHTLHNHPAAPNTTQLLDVVIDSTCADDGAIPCSSHKLPPTKCLWAWIQLVWRVYTVNDFKWGVSPATSWQFSSRSLLTTVFAMLMCYYNMHID